MPPSPQILEDLRNTYHDGKLIVFAGAGVSTAGGLPGWHTLATQLRDRLQAEGKTTTELAEVDELIKHGQLIDALSAAKHALGEHEFNLAIDKAVNDEGRLVPDLAQAIAELAPKLRAVITTNLDRFLERAFAGNWPELATPTGDLAQQSRYILKLHGIRKDRTTWVFTRGQYDRHTFGWPNFRIAFETLFRAYSILFVGYGLRDDDFDLTLAATRALAGSHPPIHFALVRGQTPPHRRRMLEGAGLRLLEYDKHDDVPGILRSLP